MKVLITGGAGFIGCNAARRFLARGEEVIVLDNLSRAGASENLAWLQDHGNAEFVSADIRDRSEIGVVFRQHADADLILHFAAQVAVTTSVDDPALDFEVNAAGTLNVLEAMRANGVRAPFIFSSTNKVYGGLEDLRVVEQAGRYSFVDCALGVPESRTLDFHSPYGCSKGTGDQYVIDYSRIYGLMTVSLRQSCIYGPRQFGVEDQGWVAWFVIAQELGLPLTIYGDGKQVRDVLFVEDLLDAYEAAAAKIDRVAGSIYNIGGGPRNTLSLNELVSFLGKSSRSTLNCRKADWRPGDQRIYVSDIRKAEAELGWQPRTNWQHGVGMLLEWVRANRDLLERSFPRPAGKADTPQTASKVSQQVGK